MLDYVTGRSEKLRFKKKIRLTPLEKILVFGIIKDDCKLVTEAEFFFVFSTFMSIGINMLQAKDTAAASLSQQKIMPTATFNPTIYVTIYVYEQD